MTKKEWDQVIDRRAQYMSAAPYSSHMLRQARALVKNFFTKNIAMAGGNYLINTQKNKNGNLQAFFMCADIPAFYNPQRSDAHMWFYSKGPFKSNQQWFAHQLKELGPFLLPDTKCRLFGQQQDWLPFFLKSGFHLDSFETVGLVDHALKVLDEIDADDIFSSRGIRLRKISQNDLNVIPQMFHREFLKRPEHCFFGKDPAVIPFMVGKLKNQLSGKDRGESLVLEKSGVVVGHIEFSISPKK